VQERPGFLAAKYGRQRLLECERIKGGSVVDVEDLKQMQ
jgi:hypothetical protein